MGHLFTCLLRGVSLVWWMLVGAWQPDCALWEPLTRGQAEPCAQERQTLSRFVSVLPE